MNHEMNGEQTATAVNELKVDCFNTMPPFIDAIWGNVDPEADFDKLEVEKIVKWLKETTVRGDYVLVQGDYGLTFAVVDWCLDNGRKAVYATTRRVAREIVGEGSTIVQREFRHVRFREYEKLNKSKKS